MSRRTCRYVVVSSFALLALVALSGGCGARHVPAGLPEPQFEPAQVMPWDAGALPPEQDPFAGAALGGWVDAAPVGSAPLPDAGTAGAAAVEVPASSAAPSPEESAGPSPEASP